MKQFFFFLSPSQLHRHNIPLNISNRLVKGLLIFIFYFFQGWGGGEMRHKLTMKVIFQGSQRHKFVDKKPLVPISTISNQVHQVRVMKKAKHEDLHKKLPITLKAISIQLLDSNDLQKARTVTRNQKLFKQKKKLQKQLRHVTEISHYNLSHNYQYLVEISMICYV